MRIVPVPIHSDNYAYLLIDEKTNVAAAVDPSEPDKVLEAAKKENVKITAILTTHHHKDHAAGNGPMKKALPDVLVYANDERVDALTNKVEGGETFKVGSLTIKVHFTPCHTTGHVLYEVHDDNQSPAIFTGDTLFVGSLKKTD